MRESSATAALSAALIAVGALAWWLGFPRPLVVDGSALVALPLQIGSWQGTHVPLESSVESILQADFNVQRAYRHPSGALVWLYVGYYGTRRGGRPEHTPRGCYTGAGWAIEDTRVVDVGRGLRVNEYVVEQDGKRRLVHFWYRSHRRTGILGGLDQNLDRLVGRLVEGRADGALIRISTPFGDAGDRIPARSRLRSFASSLDPLIGARWPSERTPGGSLTRAE